MLTNREIIKQIDLGNITINNLKAYALDKPNSCKVHLENELYIYSIDTIDTLKKEEYLNEIKSGNLKHFEKIIIPNDGLILEPKKLYLALSREEVITSSDFIPELNGCVSLSLLGLSIHHNQAYHGNFDDRFLISMVASKKTKIYPNITIGNLSFYSSEEKNNGYGMLSGKEIKNRMDNSDIIIRPDDNILINPNSVNLTLSKYLGYYKNDILDIRNDNEIGVIDIPDDGILLYPNELYLGVTNEYTETNNLIPMISGRSSLGRIGFHAHCSASMGSIGYKGNWHLSIRCVGPQPLRIYKNMKCCQIYYYTPVGSIIETYNGSMQNISEDTLGSQYFKKLTRKK